MFWVADCPDGEGGKDDESQYACHGVAYPSPFGREVQAFGSDKDITITYHCHEHRWHEADHIPHRVGTVTEHSVGMFLTEEVDRCSPKGEGSEGLVGPCEISPYDIEVDEGHSEDRCKEREGDE